MRKTLSVRSVVPVNVTIHLALESAATNVTVEASSEDLLENTPITHTDVDRDLFEKLPLESASSSVSSLVTLATPGIAADSNGLFHGMGDHAENSFSIDGQPITDQLSKVFSNQIPTDAIESLEVIPGAPPAQYGDKTSVVINVTTRSGQGLKTPTGTITTSYGSFRHRERRFQFCLWRQEWGNFISASGLNTGRFLDPPEFTVMHDKGNEENIFDRIDYQFSSHRLVPPQSRIHSLLVPDTQLLRHAGCDRVEWTGGRQRRTRAEWIPSRAGRPAFADRHLQYRSVVDTS